jgi:hypothetical protein
VGLTIIVNVFVGPLQLMEPPVNTGVTVIVAVTAVDPVFVAVNAVILPEPLAASPIDGVLFVQEYEVALVPENVTKEVEVPLQTI